VGHTSAVKEQQLEPSEFYTGLVAQMYRHLRSETFDPEPYARFVTRSGQPALELGCGDGDPILDLRERGLDIEGLDSSADMLDRCRAAAAARGVEVVLHHATFESMDLGRRYASIYLAGATFNLLPDDDIAQRALERIAAHLQPGGSALIPLFIPGQPSAGPSTEPREAIADDGSTMRVTALAVDRDQVARVQTTTLRYELIAGEHVDSVERQWVLHWFEQQQFTAMAERAGLSVHGVFANDGLRASSDDTSFTFWLRLDDVPLTATS
jgi:SAM-dependent methyltransferase